MSVIWVQCNKIIQSWMVLSGNSISQDTVLRAPAGGATPNWWSTDCRALRSSPGISTLLPGALLMITPCQLCTEKKLQGSAVQLARGIWAPCPRDFLPPPLFLPLSCLTSSQYFYYLLLCTCLPHVCHPPLLQPQWPYELHILLFIAVFHT